MASLPMRERELKFAKLVAVATSGKSLPTLSRGIRGNGGGNSSTNGGRVHMQAR